jgi:hypothetical protein
MVMANNTKLVYFKTQFEAVEMENEFWANTANPVNQPSSDVERVAHRDNAPLHIKDWTDCWICRTTHWGSD